MKNPKVLINSNLNSLKDLIVNNPRAKDRITIKEIERDIKQTERGENKSRTGLWEL